MECPFYDLRQSEACRTSGPASVADPIRYGHLHLTAMNGRSFHAESGRQDRAFLVGPPCSARAWLIPEAADQEATTPQMG